MFIIAVCTLILLVVVYRWVEHDENIVSLELKIEQEMRNQFGDLLIVSRKSPEQLRQAADKVDMVLRTYTTHATKNAHKRAAKRVAARIKRALKDRADVIEAFSKSHQVVDKKDN